MAISGIVSKHAFKVGPCDILRLLDSMVSGGWSNLARRNPGFARSAAEALPAPSYYPKIIMAHPGLG
jgi:hypothetical protein